MIKRLFFILAAMAAAVASTAQVTLEQCKAYAAENYPLLHKYGLIDRIRDVDLSEINKGWLPQIDIYGQATAQNVVPAFPDKLSGILEQMGADVRGLGKVQYKAGIDLSQTIWDGGSSKARRELARATTDEQRSAVDVQMYAINQRVENLFFGILLIEEQTRQIMLTRELLESNLAKLRSMKANGTAMQSDIDMVEAQELTVGQQLIQAKSNVADCRKLLGLYTGQDMSTCELAKPAPTMPSTYSSDRPELRHFDAALSLNRTQLENVKASLMPKIGLFAQAYYGYPGFDYFKSMMSRDLSFNVLAGVKVSWNIGSFYTKSNREQKLKLSGDGIVNDREVFLFNIGLETQAQTDAIEEYKALMAEDSRIVDLRANVRRAAESQLENGVIDATALLTKITDENQARLNAAYHEIQMIQSIYKLKYTLNR